MEPTGSVLVSSSVLEMAAFNPFTNPLSYCFVTLGTFVMVVVLVFAVYSLFSYFLDWMFSSKKTNNEQGTNSNCIV